jgi:hypothetical protein
LTADHRSLLVASPLSGEVLRVDLHAGQLRRQQRRGHWSDCRSALALDVLAIDSHHRDGRRSQ